MQQNKTKTNKKPTQLSEKNGMHCIRKESAKSLLKPNPGIWPQGL